MTKFYATEDDVPDCVHTGHHQDDGRGFCRHRCGTVMPGMGPGYEEAMDLHGEADWLDFASNNLEPLLETFPTLDAAKDAAEGEGFLMGGGAAPLVRVRLLAERAA